MDNINQRFDLWTKKLYDISKKNYMINFVGQSNRSVLLTSPSMDDLYNLLVTNDKTLSFKRSITRDNNFNIYAISTLLGELGSDLSFKEGDIDTSAAKDKDPYDVLRNIKRVATDFKLEQGIDVMYVTFAYVLWKPIGQVDYFKTPLINVPVVLEQENINSLYTITRVGDPEINPIFKYMLEKQNTTLPELFDKSISEYLRELDSVANANGWEIIFETSLSILFFQKMVMFKDLVSNKENIYNHEILRAFCNDLTIEVHEKDLDFDHDAEDERTRLLVVDADASQMDALTLASKGQSFVLQGPPGTGKSQTITNIIAQAIGEGKKVLFVSQKTAALEVVHSKLKEAGLDQFCLPLHNTKENKAKIVNNIYEPYNLSKTIVKEEKLNELERMQRLKDDINQYAKAISSNVYKLDMSFYDMVNTYYKVVNEIDGDFEIPEGNEITKAELNESLSNIRMFQEQFVDFKGKFHNCYDNTTIESLTMEEKEELELNLDNAYQKISCVVEALDNINYFLPQLGVNFTESKNIVPALAKMSSFNFKNITLFNKNDYERKMIDIKDACRYLDEVNIGKAILTKYFKEDIFKEDMKRFIKDASDNTTILANEITAFIGKEQKYIYEHLGEYKQALENINKYDELQKNSILSISNILNIQPHEVLELDCFDILDSLNANDYLLPYIEIAYKHYDRCKALLYEISLIQSQINDTKDVISTFATSTIYNISLNTIKDNIDNLACTDGFLKTLFNSHAKNVRKDVIQSVGVHLKGNVRPTAESVYKVLNLLNSYYELVEKLESTIEDVRLLTRDEISINPSAKDYANHAIELDKSRKIIKLFKNVSLENLKNALRFINKDMIVESFSSLSSYQLKKMNEAKLYQIDINRVDINAQINLINQTQEKIKQIQAYLLPESDVNEISSYFNDMKNYQESVYKLKIISDRLNFFKIFPDNYFNLMSQEPEISYFFKLAKKFQLDEEQLLKSYLENQESIAKEMKEYMENFEEAFNSYTYVKSLFTEEKMIDNYSNEQLLALIKDCYDNTLSLKAKLAFNKYNKDFKNDKFIGSFVTWCVSNEIKGNLANIYQKKFYDKTIKKYLYECDYLDNIDRTKLIGKINEFTSLCKEQLEINKAIIKSNCLDKIPSIKTTLAGNDERSYLIREYHRTRKKPIRQLFNSIPHLLLDLKPCLMMSPLTVSNYLENENYKFDLVVFDEASQIRPEEAIGSIYRGKQVIIAGDSKQLPPTTFFAKKIESDVDEELIEEDFYDDEIDESILEQAVKKLPSITLLWHYRSKNESLIAFSNKNIYDSNLITFPCVKKSQEDFGVEFVYVEGIYQKKKKIANKIEADKVVEIIEKHIEDYGTSRSLGVIAFGERQRYTIERAVLDFRRKHLSESKYEKFFSSELKEPFFVKNIENVQGDERDTIIFSVGYGKDEEGTFRYNFGPLQQLGGERRLNVAISRAKHNLKVVASFMPHEIDTTRVESEGVKLFKEYLQFVYDAANNEIDKQSFDDGDGFKKRIATMLKKQGYEVVLDYGYSSFKIDIAIIDKENPNKFVCGVMLDGQNYLNEKTCKDREVLKSEVLQLNGWKVYKMFSRFYLENEEQENKDLLNFIKSNVDKEEIKEEKIDSFEYVEEVKSEIEVHEEFIEEENPYGFETYSHYDYEKYIETHEATTGTLDNLNEDLIEDVLKLQGVVHINDLSSQLAKAFMISDAKARNRVLKIIEDERFVRDRMFVYLHNCDTSIVRIVKEDNFKRPLEYIYHGEVSACLLKVLSESIGLNTDGLVREVMKLYGYKVKTSKVNDFFVMHINRLLNDQLIYEEEGTLKVKEREVA